MINKYNEFINEKLNNYRYPYDRLFIVIETKNDFLKLIDEFKQSFNINIINYETYINRINNHVALYVYDFYIILEKGIKDVDFYGLFTVFTYRTLTINQMLDSVDYSINNYSAPKNYYNREDVLYPKEYHKLKYILTKNLSFNNIYNKSSEKSYESLLNKLEGPNYEEVWKSFGYDRIFKKEEEYLDYIFSKLKKHKVKKYPQSLFLKLDNNVLFELNYMENVIYCANNPIFVVFNKIFNIHGDYIKYRLSSYFKKNYDWNYDKYYFISQRVLNFTANIK